MWIDFCTMIYEALLGPAGPTKILEVELRVLHMR